MAEEMKVKLGLKEVLAECVGALSQIANGYEGDVDAATTWKDQELLKHAIPRLASVRAALAVVERWAAVEYEPFTLGRDPGPAGFYESDGLRWIAVSLECRRRNGEVTG